MEAHTVKGHQQEGSLQPKETGLRKNKSFQYLDLTFLASRITRKQTLLFKPPRLQYKKGGGGLFLLRIK